VVELHTGRYAEASDAGAIARELEQIQIAARYADEKGLHVNAGHGLNYDNVRPVAAISEIRELNIGHAIVARAVFVGLRNAVKEMKVLVSSRK